MKFSKARFLGIKLGFLAFVLGFFANFANAADTNNLVELARKCRNNGGIACVNSFTLHKRSCEEGDKNSCGNLGLYFLYGTGTQADPQSAIKHLTQACESGLSQHCYGLAANYENGTNGISQDAAKAAALYKKACSLGYTFACKK